MRDVQVRIRLEDSTESELEDAWTILGQSIDRVLERSRHTVVRFVRDVLDAIRSTTAPMERLANVNVDIDVPSAEDLVPDVPQISLGRHCPANPGTPRGLMAEPAGTTVEIKGNTLTAESSGEARDHARILRKELQRQGLVITGSVEILQR